MCKELEAENGACRSPPRGRNAVPQLPPPGKPPVVGSCMEPPRHEPIKNSRSIEGYDPHADIVEDVSSDFL